MSVDIAFDSALYRSIRENWMNSLPINVRVSVGCEAQFKREIAKFNGEIVKLLSEDSGLEYVCDMLGMDRYSVLRFNDNEALAFILKWT
jgi:hypothetical protein